MKGTVEFFNVIKGLGFITGEDGGRYFVHQSQLRMPGGGLRFLLPGWEVRFLPTRGEKGPVAEEVNVRQADGARIIENPTFFNSQSSGVLSGEVAAMTIGMEHDVTFVGGTPAVKADTFTAYYVGGNMVKGFSLDLPVASGHEVWLVLDPAGKEPQAIPADGRYDRVPLGTYLLQVCKTGEVTVWCLGHRYQLWKGRDDDQERSVKHNWVVVERRFEHRYNFGPEAAPIAEQTETSGLARDNDGFIPAIRFGRTALGELAKIEKPE